MSAGLAASTVTPGRIPPDVSRTTPVIPLWAHAVAGRSAHIRTSRRTLRGFITVPSSHSCCPRQTLAPFSQETVETPCAGTGGPHKQVEKAKQDGGFLVRLREAPPESFGRVTQEVCECHLARQQERQRAREQAEHDHWSADQFQHHRQRAQRDRIER